MGRTYMKAEDNDAGIAVRESTDNDVFISKFAKDGYYLTPAEFRAVIEGGLRWMLETQTRDLLPGHVTAIKTLLDWEAVEDGR